MRRSSALDPRAAGAFRRSPNGRGCPKRPSPIRLGWSSSQASSTSSAKSLFPCSTVAPGMAPTSKRPNHHSEHREFSHRAAQANLLSQGLPRLTKVVRPKTRAPACWTPECGRCEPMRCSDAWDFHGTSKMIISVCRKNWNVCGPFAARYFPCTAARNLDRSVAERLRRGVSRAR